jgi:hypothetical protein
MQHRFKRQIRRLDLQQTQSFWFVGNWETEAGSRAKRETETAD